MSTIDLSWSLRDIVRIAFHYKRRGMIVFVLCMSFVVLALVLAPRKYTSEAKLFLRLGRESVTLDPTVTTGGQVMGLNSSREPEINSVIEVLRSRSIMERVFELVDPSSRDLAPQSREKALAGFMRNISIYSPKSSSVIVLTSKASSPESAQQILNTLLDVSLKEHIRINRTPGSYQFFDEQAELLKKQLDEAGTALRDAKNRYGLVTLEGRRAALEQQLAAVKTLLRESKSGLAASVAKGENLQASVDTLPSHLVQQLTGGTPSNALANMRQKLYELQAAEQELKSKLTPEHPKVIAMHRQVQQVEQILRSEMPNHDETVLALLANEQANAASLRARIDSLKDQQSALEKELRELNEHDLLVSELERNVRLLDANYVHYVTGLEQARIDQALKAEGISNINIVQAPTYSPKPSQPKKAMTLMIGMAVSLASAVGMVLVSKQLDQSIKNVDEVERTLGVPVMASIPVMSFTAPAHKPSGEPTNDSYQLKAQAQSLLGALLRQRRDGEQSLRTVGVTSCYRNEGVSTVARVLAETASEHRRTLLIDAHLSNPSAAARYKLAEQPGLVQLLRGELAIDKCIRKCGTLDVLAVGRTGVTAPLMSEQFAPILERVAQDYDLVIVDLPAVNHDATAIETSGYLDGIVLVVEAERINSLAGKRAVTRLRQSGASITGAVLNKRRDYIPEWLYQIL